MSISSIPAGQAAYNPYATQQTQKQADAAAVNRAATSDTVQISDKAKQLSQSSSQTTEAGSASFDHKNPPLEAFAIPSWLVPYHPEATNLSIENEDEYWRIMKNSLGGSISSNEQSTLDKYRELSLGKTQFRKEFDSEIREYSMLLHSAIAKALETNELSGELAYYQKVTLAQTVSADKVHQDFRQNLVNSPRAIELMKTLGIDDAMIDGLSTNS